MSCVILWIIYIVGNEPNPDNGFFLERYYENDPQKWTSVTVINFKAVFAYRKKEEVFAPFGSGAKVYDRDEIGGRAECFPCEEAIASLAERAAKAIGSQIVGFDFILTANGPIIVDVNTYPGCYKEGFTIAGRDLAEEFFIMAELDIVGGKPLSLQTPQNVL